jgi:membrane protein
MNNVAAPVWSLLRQMTVAARRDQILTLSASLAYYALFSLGPMLLLVIFVCGYFGGHQAVEEGLFVQIRLLIGPAAATQLHRIMPYATFDGTHLLRASIGLLTLLFAATSVFTEIQDSLNSIWQLKMRPEVGWLKVLKTRLLSFSLVIIGLAAARFAGVDGCVSGPAGKAAHLFSPRFGRAGLPDGPGA